MPIASRTTRFRPIRLIRAAVIVAFMLLPFLTTGGAAQVRVEGMVVTDAPGGPAEGAAVLRDGDQRTVTDADGTFSFQAPPGSYRLEIRLVGYGAAVAQLELVAGHDPQIRVQLRRLSSELDVIERDALAARRIGAVATPTLLINSKKYTGAPSDLRRIVAREIKQESRRESGVKNR